MKNTLQVCKEILLFISFVIASFNGAQAQSLLDGFEVYILDDVDDKKSDDTNDFQVSLERCIDVNVNHPYMDFFALQDEKYIIMLYALNKSNSINTPEYYNPAIIIDDQDGNNSLIFTVKKEGIIRFDTLRNTLHPGELSDNNHWDWLGLRSVWNKYRFDMQVYQQNLQGSLPKGVMTYISPGKRHFEFGLQVVAPSSEVEVVITELTGELVRTVHDGPLKRGWKKWSPKGLSRGIYTLVITVDGETLSQNFKY